MKRANVRQVQHNFKAILKWLADGEEVEITYRGKAVARISPVTEKHKRRSCPDFSKRLKELYPAGNIGPDSASDQIILDRQRF